MSDIKEILEVVGIVGEVAEGVIDGIEEKQEVIDKAFRLLYGIIDTGNCAELAHEGYHENLAKTKARLFKALKAEGFTEDQALLLMLDRELKVKRFLNTINSRSSGGSKDSDSHGYRG